MKPQLNNNPLETLDDSPRPGTVGDLQERLIVASRIIAQQEAQIRQLTEIVERTEKQARPFDDTIPG
jgi:hypothetical protein